MVTIKRTGQLDVPQSVSVLLYGQSGAGKTTMALSAEKPLVFDFDGGLQRVRASHTREAGMVQVQTWRDVLEVLNMAELGEYKTIIVDTLGKMTDAVICHMCGGRQPQLREWGAINGEIKAFMSSVKRTGKDVVFVAQREESKRGDNTFFRPAFRARNYNELVTDLDMVGYLEMRSERGVPVRTLTFDPTAENDGKNTCGLPSVITVPTAADTNTFLADQVLARCHARYEELAAAQREYASTLDDIEAAIQGITDADGANAFSAQMRTRKYANDIRLRAARLLQKKADEIGLTYDKATKAYSKA